MKLLLPLLCSTALAGAPQDAQDSPYRGEQSRAIKALSEADVKAYLDGEGHGFAKAAELNGYPGPKHVLELAEALELTPDVRAAVTGVHARMLEAARTLGVELVEQERRLDALFATRAIDAAALEAAVADSARLTGALRAVHLRAHLETAELLTPHQRRHYSVLRGYAAGHHPQH